MWKELLLTTFIVAWLGSTLAQYDPIDQSLSSLPNEDFIKTSTLPGGPTSPTAKDDQVMAQYTSRELPELSSGVIGTTVYNESIFMSGLYRTASYMGETFVTKVRIPNYAMFRINRTDEVPNTILTRNFYFNITKGLWEETIDTPNYYIRLIMGVHAHYSRTFFHAVRVTKKQSSAVQSIKTFSLSTHHANLLTDKKFNEDLLTNNLPDRLPESTGADGFKRVFTVNQAGDGSDSDIIVISNGPQTANPNEPITSLSFTFKRDSTVSENLFLQTVAPMKDQESALREYETVQRSVSDVNNFINMHTDAWEKRFKAGNIEFQGTGDNYAKLRRLTKSTLYQIYSQFPFANRYGASTSVNQYDDDLSFNGVAAVGLGRGGNSTRLARVDLAGHVTTDQELFLFAPLAILQPDLARKILFYRARQLQANNPPVPFEAARSGSSVDPLFCRHCQQQALYPTGLLGLAIRHYHAITSDETWLNLAQRGGLDTLEKIAYFFEPKIVKNTTRSGDFYSITGVCGPDERHQSQTNNLFTNALVASSVHYWSYLRCLNSKPRDTRQEQLLDRVRRLAFPFVSSKNQNEQFEGYDNNPEKAISQADAMHAYFPTAWNMSGVWLEQAQYRRLMNDLQRYNSEFRSTADHLTGAPATSIALKAITQFQVGTDAEIATGKVTFTELWQQYASSPFFVWRNMTDRGDSSAAGHVGAAAAFLETLIFGFGGLRIQANRLDIQRPALPNDINAMTFRGLHFNGGEFDLTVTSDNKIRFNPVSGSSFKKTLALYDRVKRSYEQFSGSNELTVPAQQPVRANENPSTAALFSLIVVDTSKANCKLEDANIRSHNLYYTTGGASSLNYSFTTMLTVSSIIIAFFY